MNSFKAFLNSGSFFHSFTLDKMRLFLSFMQITKHITIFKYLKLSVFALILLLPPAAHAARLPIVGGDMPNLIRFLSLHNDITKRGII